MIYDDQHSSSVILSNRSKLKDNKSNMKAIGLMNIEENGPPGTRREVHDILSPTSAIDESGAFDF